MKLQTLGWEESLRSLAATMRSKGPFEGVLGFSQGGGVVAGLLAAIQAGRPEVEGCQMPRFAMLFSGHVPGAGDLRRLLRECGPIAVPSFHCFGGTDRQVRGICESVLLNRQAGCVR